MKKVIGLLTVTLILTGCSISQTIDPVNYNDIQKICIIENPKVRSGFLKSYKQSLDEKNISYSLINSETEDQNCEWTSTYNGRWSWDLAIYMSYAEIKIYKNNGLRGQAVYDSRRAAYNANKFIKAEIKVKELVDQLFKKL